VNYHRAPSRFATYSMLSCCLFLELTLNIQAANNIGDTSLAFRTYGGDTLQLNRHFERFFEAKR